MSVIPHKHEHFILNNFIDALMAIDNHLDIKTFTFYNTGSRLVGTMTYFENVFIVSDAQ